MSIGRDRPNAPAVEKPAGEFWITYAGTLGTSYDIPTLIRAADLLKKRGENDIRVMLLGDGPLRGEFQVLTAAQSLRETAELIRNLDVSGMHFTSDHASNYLPLKGTLCEDREKLLGLINGALEGNVAIRAEQSRGL